MNSKYILAKSKDNEIMENGACGGAVTSIFKYLLDEKIVDGVLALRAAADVYDGVPVVVTDSKDLYETCGSYHCAPTMFGDLIRRFLKDKKIAVSVKPCDIRAINEIIKRNEINPENIITVGLNCGGTVSPITAMKMIDKFYDVDFNDVVKEEIDKGKFIIELKDGTEKAVKIDLLEDEGYGRRENCQRCDVKIPRKADIACGNWGAEEGWTFIEINTDKGEEILDNAKKAGYIEVNSPSEKNIQIRSKIENLMIKMSKNTQEESFKETDTEVWNRCLHCFACRDACPICVCCDNCEMEKSYFSNISSVPTNPLISQGIRLSHMSFSCVDCGQCDDVCPMDIPVSRTFDKLRKKYEEKHNYISGITDGKPPMYSGKKEAMGD